MRESAKRILVLTKRNLLEISRDPLSIIFTIGLPLLMEVLFYFMFHGMTSQFEMKYLAPGIVVFSQSFLTLFTGILLATDRNTSFLTRLYVSKARSHEFIFSYAFAVLPIALVQALLFFAVGVILDHSIFGPGMLLAVLLSLIPALLFVALGILFGSVCNERSVGGIASIVISGQSLLSGMWFPVEGLNKGIITVMKVLPFKNAAMFIQNTMNGRIGDVDSSIIPLIIVIIYTVAVFAVAIPVFKSKMKA